MKFGVKSSKEPLLVEAVMGDAIEYPGDSRDPGNSRDPGVVETLASWRPLSEVATDFSPFYPYRTILGEPLGPENIGALGSIKEGHWVRKWRATVSNCGL